MSHFTVNRIEEEFRLLGELVAGPDQNDWEELATQGDEPCRYVCTGCGASDYVEVEATVVRVHRAVRDS